MTEPLPANSSAEASATPSETVAAGPFADWLTRMRASLRGNGGTDVPCGDCVGCCVSSYYIPIRPSDAAARARIPSRLLVQAKGQPPGHCMMVYGDDGLCPMMNHGKCTIYDVRPQTCRDYDCRIFAAAGIETGAEKHIINRRVRAWRFTYPTAADEAAHKAVLAASSFIQAKADSFPGGRAPTAPTGIAVLAIKAYELFLAADSLPTTDEAIARAIIEASRQFDA